MRSLVDKDLGSGLCHVWREAQALVRPAEQVALGNQVEDGGAGAVPPLWIGARLQEHLESLLVPLYHGMEQEAEVTLKE